MTKEWQEASNELAIAQKMNPIHGMRAAHSEALCAHNWLMSRDLSQVSPPRATPGRASSPPSRQGLAPTGNKFKADRRSRIGVAARHGTARTGCAVPPAGCTQVLSSYLVLPNNDILVPRAASRSFAVGSSLGWTLVHRVYSVPGVQFVNMRNLELPGHHCLRSRLTFRTHLVTGLYNARKYEGRKQLEL